MKTMGNMLVDMNTVVYNTTLAITKLIDFATNITDYESRQKITLEIAKLANVRAEVCTNINKLMSIQGLDLAMEIPENNPDSQYTKLYTGFEDFMEIRINSEEQDEPEGDQ